MAGVTVGYIYIKHLKKVLDFVIWTLRMFDRCALISDKYQNLWPIVRASLVNEIKFYHLLWNNYLP